MDTSFDMISSYSRTQAIEDGTLVDVSETAKKTGLRFPVAVTSAVFERYLNFTSKAKDFPHQDFEGRLKDLLWMLRNAAKRGGSEIYFQVIFQMDGDWEPNEKRLREAGKYARLVTLKAVCGPGDTPEPVITILTPDED